MALSTEQVLLLNNLMYMGSSLEMGNMATYEGRTVSDWLAGFDVNALDMNKNYGSYITGQDWKNLVNAIRSDSTLMDMTIADVHVDNAPGGGGGRSAVFVSSSSGDAVVAFRGTASEEWADNFAGGNLIDTPQQQNALQWYQQVREEHGLDNYNITVTGHSKGGNKAKYITVLDPSVDNCISFDGQGFSDLFMEHYAQQIADRQGIIENHNVDNDYVNLLLNDIGNTTYYTAHNIGEGGFLENHCPNAFLEFSPDGSFRMNVNPQGRPEYITAADDLLNSLLRSMSPEQRDSTLSLVNVIINEAFNINEDTNVADLFLSLAADPQYSDELSYLLAYIVEYAQVNPQIAAHVDTLLGQFGLEGTTDIVNTVSNLINLNVDTPFGTLTFDSLWSIVDGLAGVIPDWLLSCVSQWLADECNIHLSNEQLRNLLNLVRQVDEHMETIEVAEGGDIQIPSTGSSSGSSSGGMGSGTSDYQVSPEGLVSCARSLRFYSARLQYLSDRTGEHAAAMTFSFSGSSQLRRRLSQTQQDIRQLSTELDAMSSALNDIAQLYRNTELSIRDNTR